MKDTGGPAFPVQSIYVEDQETNSRGMTLRDYFAAHASNEDIADVLSDMARVESVRELNGGRREIFYGLPDNARQIARYVVADAMLKAREA